MGVGCLGMCVKRCVFQIAFDLFRNEVLHVREESERENNSRMACSLTSPVVVLSQRCQVQPGHVLAARLLAIRVRASHLSAADPPRVTSDGRLLDLHP